MQRVFSAKMAATGDPTYSAAEAGYASPAIAGSKLMRSADVPADVKRRLRHRLVTEGAEIGLDALIDVAGDKTQKAAARVMAGKSLVQMAGIASADAFGEADLSEMSYSTLIALADEARRRLKTIEHAPIAQAAPNIFE